MMRNLITVIVFLTISTSVIFPKDNENKIDSVKTYPIVVSGNRESVIYTSIGRLFNIIPQSEIKQIPAEDIIELFRNSGGIDIRSRGNITSQADISIRGGNFEQGMILLNGIPINDPQTGHHNMDIPVSMDDISRMEILYGSASRLLGPNAFSGAINIMTGTDVWNTVKAAVSGGSAGYVSAEAGVALSNGSEENRFTNLLSVNYAKSDGYARNTDFDNINAFWNSNYGSGSMKIHAQAGYLQKAFGANSFYTPKYPDQYEETRTLITSLSGEFGENFKITPSVYWRRHDDKFELFRWERPSWYTGHNYHETNVLGAGSNFMFASAIGLTNFGINFRNESIKSNVLGTPNGDTIEVAYDAEGKYTRFAERGILNMFLEQDFTISGIDISLGALASHSTDYDWNFYPGVDVSYRLDNTWALFGNINRSLRLPSYTELYYSDPANRGNSNLKPEESLSYEVGVKYDESGLACSVSVFQRRSDNLIDWVKLPGDSLFRCTNLTEMTSAGLDVSLSVMPDLLVDKKFPIRSIRLAYTLNSLDRNEDNFISEYALDYLKNKINLTVTHDLIFDITASWNISFNDRAGKYQEYPSNEIKTFDPYALVDIKFAREFDSFSAYIQVTNLTDAAYIDFANLVPPGRMVYGGVRMKLGI